MITIKTEAELAIIKEAGRRLRLVMKELVPQVRPGITTLSIDEAAQQLIKKQGGEPGFMRVHGYKWATCLTINEQAVHTPPSKRILKDGDLLTIDIGLYMLGFHTDHAISFIVGNTKDPKVQTFLDVGEATLKKAIKSIKIGGRIGDISKTISDEIYGHGYFILKELTGHGVGAELHEDPMIPGFLDRPIQNTDLIRPGMVIAVEIIYSMGTERIVYERGDAWSIKTADGSLSACFEHTIGIYSDKAEVLT